MDERQRLQQTIRRFGSEMDRLLASSFVNLPASLAVLVDALESETVIVAYLNECREKHVPTGFDAAAEVERVASSPHETFGPLPQDTQGATGEAYLVVRELLRRGVKFHDPLFMGYVDEPAHPKERFGAFKTQIIIPLIDEVTSHLQALAAEAGIESPETSGEQAQGEAEQEAAGEAVDMSPEHLQVLLKGVDNAIESLPKADREDARLQLEALSDELADEHPKASVVRVLLRALRLIATDASWRDAVERLEQCLQMGGIC